jgi:DNA polymerase III subunit beta
MKVICTQENLRNGLQTVSRIISSSNTLPILNNVLLTTENGMLKLAGTNLEIAISTNIRCKIEQEGSVCLVAKTITELVNNLPNTNITIETTDTDAVITTEHYETKIKHLPAEEFPLIPRVDDATLISLDSGSLKTSLDQVVFAASTSETQPEISGVLWAGEKQVSTFAATDRYRLAEKTVTLENNEFSRRIIIPYRTVQELSRLLGTKTGPVNIYISDTQLAAVLEETTLVSRLVDGTYPDYRPIIPETTTTTVTIERSSFASALKTSGIFSRGVGSVTMNYNVDKQVVVISSQSHEIGESKIELPCQVQGTSGSVILNYRYVLDVLNNLSDETLIIKIIDDSAPVVFEPQGRTDYLYLVMPIKV